MKNGVLFILLSFYGFSQSNFELGKQYFDTENWQLAEKYFQKSIIEFPNDAKTIEYLGDSFAYQENWDLAIENYEILKEKYPIIAKYHYKYGGAMAMKAKTASFWKAYGMIGKIENAFITATKLDKNYIDARWALVVFYVELPAIVGGSEKKSQKYADELMILSKVDGYLAKGYIDEYFERYNNAEKNYIEAHKIGNSKTTFSKLYDLYLNKLKNTQKATQLKAEFYKNRKLETSNF